jgi:hypothetical protein
MQGASSSAQPESRRRRRSNLLAALGLAVLQFAVGPEQNPTRYLASVLGGLPAPQADEASYYKNAYTIIDLPLAEVLADFPELQGLEPAASQQELPTILSKVGTTVEQLYQNLPSVAADERITQEQCDYHGRATSTTHHDFGYLIIVNHDGPIETVQEYRTDARMKPVESTGVGEGFNFTKDFASLWLLFYPDNQSSVNFRYLGNQASPGGNRYVVAFAERSDNAVVKGYAEAEGRSVPLLYQGVAWIDAITYRIARMRLDLLEPRLDIGLERMTIDLQFGEVHIPQAVSALWLPREVTVTSIYNGQMYRNRHLYFNFKRFTVNSEIKPTVPAPSHPPN